MVWSLIQNFFNDLLTSIIEEYLTAFETMIGSLFRSAFMIETLPGLDSTVLSTAVVKAILHVLYSFLVCLLALKLIWKGAKVYILWRDGESETPPGEMVIGAVFAMIVAVGFPLLYEIAVDIVIEISAAVFDVLGYSGAFSQSNNLLQGVSDAYANIQNLAAVVILLSVVYLIVLIFLIFKLLAQGAELLVWRLGVPLAVIGLVDSDGGAWKPYIQMLFKQLATLLVQYFCIVIGTRLIAGLSVTGLVVGIAFEFTAFAAPKLMSQFMAPAGGGGATQKLYTISMVLRAFGV